MRLEFANGGAARARTIVVASGAAIAGRPSPISRHSKEGISYWASPIEAQLCEGEEVALVGGGNSAGQAVVYLAPQVKRLHLVVRGRPGVLDVALSHRSHRRAAQCRASHRDRGDRAEGDESTGLTGAEFRERATGEVHTCSLRHLFLFIGADPNAVVARRMRGSGRQRLCGDRNEMPASNSGRRCRSRPVSPAFSPSAMSAPDRPSASPPRSARAQRWWRRFTRARPGAGRGCLKRRRYSFTTEMSGASSFFMPTTW